MGHGASQLRSQAQGKDFQQQFPFMTDWDWDLPPEVIQRIRQELGELTEQEYWREIQAVTEKHLTGIIAEGLQEGWNSYKIGMQIRTGLGEGPIPNKRAQRISRTETSAALNAGHQLQTDALADAGIAYVKTWTTVGDRGVRACHVDLEGVGASVKGTWELAGVQVPYPAHWSLPGRERVNCRCSFYTDVIEEEAPEPVVPGEEPLF